MVATVRVVDRVAEAEWAVEARVAVVTDPVAEAVGAEWAAAGRVAEVEDDPVVVVVAADRAEVGKVVAEGGKGVSKYSTGT